VTRDQHSTDFNRARIPPGYELLSEAFERLVEQHHPGSMAHFPAVNDFRERTGLQPRDALAAPEQQLWDQLTQEHTVIGDRLNAVAAHLCTAVVVGHVRIWRLDKDGNLTWAGRGVWRAHDGPRRLIDAITNTGSAELFLVKRVAFDTWMLETATGPSPAPQLQPESPLSQQKHPSGRRRLPLFGEAAKEVERLQQREGGIPSRKALRKYLVHDWKPKVAANVKDPSPDTRRRWADELCPPDIPEK
jgi:hypothetical protein